MEQKWNMRCLTGDLESVGQLGDDDPAKNQAGNLAELGDRNDARGAAGGLSSAIGASRGVRVGLHAGGRCKESSKAGVPCKIMHINSKSIIFNSLLEIICQNTLSYAVSAESHMVVKEVIFLLGKNLGKQKGVAERCSQCWKMAYHQFSSLQIRSAKPQPGQPMARAGHLEWSPRL